MSPYVIGLTGNIATGKSTVARMLERLGASVLDADQLSRQVQRAGTDIHRRVVERFGAAIVGPDGEIDRAALGNIVFANAQALADLEALVHPAVIAETRRWLSSVQSEVAVVEAIKLLEAGMRSDCDALWVVTSPDAVQEQRLRATRGLTQAQARARIDAQPPQELKIGTADVVIDNGGSLEATWQQVLSAWNALPDVQAVPTDTAWDDHRDIPPAPSAARPAVWQHLLLAIGMALLVLLFSAGAALTVGQRVWFAFLGAALGVACSWMISWE